MKAGDQYLKIVEWSEEDGCYVGTCPGLMLGGVHGDDETPLRLARHLRGQETSGQLPERPLQPPLSDLAPPLHPCGQIDHAVVQ